MIRNLMVLSIVFMLFSSSVAQKKESINSFSILNEYVGFANESIHGMLIAHRLFENYNQDINKYVDLPDHKLNFYNNTDLPQDIFDDPDHWFYEKSPKELYLNTFDNVTALSLDDFEKLQNTITNIRGTTLKSNELRLFIGEAINKRNLSVEDTLYTIYELLEEAVDAYDLFQAELTILESQLSEVSKKIPKNEATNQYTRLIKILTDIHFFSQQVLLSIKNEETEALSGHITGLKNTQKTFESYSIRSSGGFASSIYVRSRTRVLENINLLISGAEEYLTRPVVPEEYALYGTPYFYYNTRLINKVNRYGNGLVQACNEIIDLLKLPMLHRLEIPHYLMIIYPQKVEKQLPVIESSVHEILAAPKTLEDRSIEFIDNKHVIYVDGADPELEVFDHLQQDGDIISLNFNGDWIFRNLSLERKPRKFILKLNQTGKNFLILHAVNEGSVPPNTIGINYTSEGRRKRYVMQSNLKMSQMVEIKMTGKTEE
jgi:hypothetical protein